MSTPPHSPTRGPVRPVPTVLLLAAITALGPLATDMYLPAMPAMAESLRASPGMVQLTLSLYMAGFALNQLFCGPVSDRFGRKPVLIGGLGLFFAASLLCALAQSIELLLLGRFLQALGGATGPVLGRAAVRDLYGPREAGRVLSYMASAMALAPAVAPIVGGLLLASFGWPLIFLVLAGYALLVATLLAVTLPEPLRPEYRQSIRPGVILGNFAVLLGDRRYVGYTLTNAFAFCGLFAFLSGSSFVLIDFLDVGPTAYGLYFALCVVGFFCGTLVSARLSGAVAGDRLMTAGSILCTLGGVSMAVLALAGVYHVAAVIGPHMLFLMGVGILMPQTMAAALAPFPRFAGSASSLFGFLQMTTAALVGAAVGQLHDGTSRTMAVAIAASGLAALAAHRLLARRPAPAAGSAAYPADRRA